MPDSIVDIHPDVLAFDTQEVANYIAMVDEGAAARVLAQIDATYHLLADQPLLRTEYHPIRQVLKGIRMFPVTEYSNYLIYYRPLPENSGVRILYVLHAARDATTFASEHRRQ